MNLEAAKFMAEICISLGGEATLLEFYLGSKSGKITSAVLVKKGLEPLLDHYMLGWGPFAETDVLLPEEIEPLETAKGFIIY
jgi:hypothetical protein